MGTSGHVPRVLSLIQVSPASTGGARLRGILHKARPMPDPAPHPDRPRWRSLGALALAALLCVGAALWWRLGPVRPPVVAVEIMAAGPVTRVLAVNGKIAPRERVAIRAAVGDIVLSVAVAAGDVVTAGAVLARLDDRQQAAALRQAEAELAQAVAQLKTIKRKKHAAHH